MLNHLMDNIGAALVDTKVPLLNINITPSMITLESTWGRGDGTHISKQRVITSALLHDKSLSNFTLNFADSRDRTRTVVKGQVTPDADVQSPKVRHRKTDVCLNFVNVVIGATGYDTVMQMQGAPIPDVPYIHGVCLSIKKGASATQVSSAVRATLHTLTKMHADSTSAIASTIIVQQPHPRPIPVHGFLTSHALYENTIQADIDQYRGEVDPSKIRIQRGRLLHKVRYGK